MKKYLSLILKILIVVCVLIGIILNSISAGFDGYAHWLNRFMYFTTQSNIWIALIMLAILIYSFYEKQKHLENPTRTKNVLYVLKFIFTVSITVTGVVYCAFLGPNANSAYHPWSISSCFVHIIVPVLSILDFFLDDYKIIYTKKEIPPLSYCFVSAILYYLGVDFGRGENFPYFFLNFGSPAGFFGFSSELPYIMGSFYWLVIFLVLIFSISFGLAKLHPNSLKNNISRKKSFLIS